MIAAGVRASRPGRPALAEDRGARALFEQAEKVRAENPRMTLEQVAARVGISVRQYQRYRTEFGD
jgi:hypothetical protein